MSITRSKADGQQNACALPLPMAVRFQNLDKLHLPPLPSDGQRQLERVLTALVTDYGAERIIAFGSCVRGDASEHSDVDLCVVRDHAPGVTHPQLEAGLCVARTRPRISTDLLVRTPGQFQQAVVSPFGVMEEVIRNGVTLYERRSA
jgi:hypothetical protein